jgi:2-amino-4-hydroxy-6-hydroxymethyldihydropteridine diphosphokinase
VGTRGYLGLGSNIGERVAHLQEAIAALAERGVAVTASSSVYETEPVGLVLDQREFFNACIAIETDDGPDELLRTCKEVERAIGREASGVRHGARVIDVDVLLLGNLVYESERLKLPHPEVSSRRFVLVPLLELDPDATLPNGDTLTDALESLGGGQEVRLVAPPLL